MGTTQLVNLLTVLVPIVTPIVGAVVVTLREWRSRRSNLGRRKLALDDAQAQVAFVNDWWNARRAVDVSGGPESSSSKEAERLARAWLDQASRQVADNELWLVPVEPAVSFRRLALLYEFRSTAGKVVRVLFWILCGLTVTTVGLAITQLIGPDEQLVVGLATARVSIFSVLAGAVVFPLTVALRFVAIAVDAFATRPPDPDRRTYGFLREMLLLRPLCGRGAGAVRLVFYISVVSTIGYVAYAVYVLQLGLLWFVPLSVAGVIVLVAAILGIRAWAVFLDRAARRGSARALPVQEAARDQVVESAPVP